MSPAASSARPGTRSRSGASPSGETTLWHVEPYWDIDTLFELMPQTLEVQGVGAPPMQGP